MTASPLTNQLHRALDRRADRPVLLGQGGSRLTGTDILSLAGRLNAVLTGPEAGSPQVVAIYGRPSIETVAAVYAVLLSGRTYCCVDHGVPLREAEAIAAQMPAAAVLVGAAANSDVLAALATGGCPRIPVAGLLAGPPASPVPTVRCPTADEAAYVLFTSGSTGVPKGVCVSHATAWAAQTRYWADVTLGPDDTIANEVVPSFDVSTFDLFGILRDACVAVPEIPGVGESGPAFFAFLRESKASLTFSVPSVIHELAHAATGPLGLDLRVLALSGEPLSPGLIARIRAAMPGTRLFNLFGMTEAPYILSAELPLGTRDQDLNSFPFPPDATDLSIRGGESEWPLTAAPAKARGELILGGTGLCNGYIDPSGAALRGRTLSRTGFGDWFEVLPGRRLRFLGRKGRIAKVWGATVYLDRVEAILAGHPLVRRAVVLPGGNGQVLIAAIEATPAGAGASAAQIGEVLARDCAPLLDRYHIPTRWLVLDRFPRTASGKIDRREITRLLIG